MLFPAPADRAVGPLSAAYFSHARQQLHRTFLTPLRAAAKLPEVFMSAGRWGDIDYSRVASVCMSARKGLFEKRDRPRFEEYLFSVSEGEERIAAGALKPCEITTAAVHSMTP